MNIDVTFNLFRFITKPLFCNTFLERKKSELLTFESFLHLEKRDICTVLKNQNSKCEVFCLS